MNNQRIVVNITGSARWRRRPVGIIRVERELIKQIRRLHPTMIEPVLLDIDAGAWSIVGPSLFDQICSDNWVQSDNPDTIPESLKKERAPFKPRNNDKFVSVGSDWSFDIPKKVGQLYNGSKVLIPALYDLIPLVLPEFTPGPEFYAQFHRHYDHVARLSRAIFSISEHSKNDLVKFWEQEKICDNLPNVEVIPLAGLNCKTVLPKLNAADNAQLSEILNEGKYVIFVSTIEPRKNHQMMLDIWRQLHLELGQNCPHLIFIGMRGWGVVDLLEQMGRMNATREGYILWLEGIKDELLMHLYANALFAVLPSHYEGWGLAATEASSFGKICVTSNNSALLEATGGFSPSFHPLDLPAWKCEIKRLIVNPEYRKNLEANIMKNFIHRTWDDFGNDFSIKLL